MILETIIELGLGFLVIGEILFWINGDFDKDDYVSAVFLRILILGFIFGAFKGWKSLMDNKKIRDII